MKEFIYAIRYVNEHVFSVIHALIEEESHASAGRHPRDF